MPSSDLNLLFGVLALQLNFISREALISAMGEWVLAKDRPLGEILQGSGNLNAERRQLLDALVQEHLRQHSGDAQQSLAAMSSIDSVRNVLKEVADPDLQASVAHLAQGDKVSHDAETVIPVQPLGGTSGDGSAAAAVGTRFRILRPHARGGLGQVSVALDEELHREVALKEIQSQHADNTDSRSRFVLEAEITGRLEHPGIVPVYGLGHYADGRPFYAMRFIQGDSLKAAIEAFHRPASPGQAKSTPSEQAERNVQFRQLLRRFVDVCNTMAYAHSRGILHRDLKPGNIMVGKYGETLVVDWGLAKIAGRDDRFEGAGETTLIPSSGSSVEKTIDGSVIGTPAFMSPEQAAGKLDQLGPATDVYSLGATLYQVLTQCSPFEKLPLTELLNRVQKGDFQPPRAINPQVPKPLDAICLKAMSLRPHDRYRSTAELAADVERFLADEPVLAHAEPLVIRTRRWVKRHQTLVGSTAAAVLVATVALSVLVIVVTGKNAALETANTKIRGQSTQINEQNETLRQTNVQLTTANSTINDQNSAITAKNKELQNTNAQLALARTDAEQKRDAAIKQKTRADEQAAIATAVNRFLRQVLLAPAYIANQDPAYGDRDPNITVREMLDRSAKGIEGSFGKQPLVEASIRQTIGDTYQKLAKFEDAELHLEAALRIRLANLSEDHPEVLSSMNSIASLYHARGLDDKAETLFQKVMERRKQILGGDHKDTLASMDGLALVYESRGRYDEAEVLYNQVLESERTKHGENDIVSFSTMGNLAELYRKRGRYDEAEVILKQALNAHRKELGEDQPRVLGILNGLAVICQTRGRYDEAEALYKQILEVMRAKLGEDHRQTLATMNNLADLYRILRRYDESLKLFETALELQRRKYGTDHPFTFAYMNNLGGLYHALHRYDDAEPLFKKVLELRRQKLGADHPDTITSMQNLAALHRSRGRFDDAEALFRESIELGRKTLGADHPSILNTIYNLAQLCEVRGRFDEAVQLHKETLDGRIKKLGEDHPDTLTSMLKLARIRLSLGEYDEAELLFNRALKIRRQKLGDDHPDTVACIAHLAGVCLSRNRLKEAELLYKDALQKFREKLGENDPNTLSCMNNLAEIYRKSGRFIEAEFLYRQTLESRRKSLGDDHLDTLGSMDSLATLYDSMGRLDMAEPLYKQVLEQRLQKLGDDHPDTLESMNNMATIDFKHGRIEEATTLFKSSIAGAKRRLGPGHPETRTYIRNLLFLYRQTKRTDSAELLLRELAEIQKQKSGADSTQYATELISLGVNLIAQRKDAEGTATLAAAGEILKRDKKAGPESAAYSSLLVQWGKALLDTQQFELAESRFREYLALRQKLALDDWSTLNAHSLLGACLAGQKNFAAAEPLLLSGYEGLKTRAGKIPKNATQRLPEAAQRLIDLYTLWGKPEKAGEWKKKLEELMPTKEENKEDSD